MNWKKLLEKAVNAGRTALNSAKDSVQDSLESDLGQKVLKSAKSAGKAGALKAIQEARPEERMRFWRLLHCATVLEQDQLLEAVKLHGLWQVAYTAYKDRFKIDQQLLVVMLNAEDKECAQHAACVVLKHPDLAALPVLFLILRCVPKCRAEVSQHILARDLEPHQLVEVIHYCDTRYRIAWDRLKAIPDVNARLLKTAARHRRDLAPEVEQILAERGESGGERQVLT